MNILETNPLVPDSRDGICRTNTHDAWRNTNSRSRNELIFAKDGKTEAFSDQTARKQKNSSSSVRYL